MIKPLIIIMTGFAYFAVAHGGLYLATINHNISPFWPASGLAIAAAWHFGLNASIGIFIGAFFANYLTGSLLISVFLIALGNTGEAVLCVYLLNKFFELKNKKKFLGDALAQVFAIFISCTVSATVGITALIIGHILSPKIAIMAWLTWWGGDAVGALLFLPLLIAYKEVKKTKWNLNGLLLSFTSLLVVTGFVFSSTQGHGAAYLLFLPLLISATYLPRHAAFLFNIIIALILVIFAYFGKGPYSNLAVGDSLLGLQFLLGTMVLTTHFLTRLQEVSLLRKLSSVFITGWAITGALFCYFYLETGRANQVKLEKAVEEAENKIKIRMNTYVEALKASAAYYSVNKEKTFSTWKEYINTLAPHENYPGINGMGFVFPVNKSDIEKFEKKVRKTKAGFSVHKVKNAPEYLSTESDVSYVISLLEPLEGNLPALGLDLASEKNRKDAADRARDTGEPNITSKIILVQDTVKRAGFLLYVPIYNTHKPPITVESRRQEFVGWSYAPFVTEKFLNGVLGAQESDLGYSIFEGETTDKNNLLYSSTKNYETNGILRNIELASHSFSILWSPSPSFQKSDSLLLTWTGGLGALLTLLVALLMAKTWSYRKRAEEEVEYAVRSLHRVIQSVGNILIATDEKGIITLFNPMAEKLLGYSADEIVGKQSPSVFHDKSEVIERSSVLSKELRKEILPGFDTFVEKAKTGNIDQNEWTYIKKDGTRFPVLLSVSALFNKNNQIEGYIGTAVDLSEKKKLEKDLIKQLDRFDLMVQGSSVGMWDWFDVNDKKKYWSPKFYELLGYELGEIEPTLDNFQELLHPDEREKTFTAVAKHFKDNTPFELEYRLKHKKDGYRWFWGTGYASRDKTGRPIRMVGSIADIHARKLLQETIKKSENQLSIAFEAAPIGFLSVNTDGNITFVNSPTSKLFGYSKQELIGMHVDALVPKRFRNGHAEKVQGYMKSPTARSLNAKITLYGLRKDGSEFPVEISLAPVETPEGLRVISSITDITERKNSENLIEKTLKELTRSNQELEQFAYVASHDLQTPLRHISSFNEMISQKLETNADPDIRKWMGYVDQGVERMRGLINDLLTYSRVRKSDLEMERVDLNALIEDIINAGALGSNEEVEVKLDPLPLISGYPTYLSQLFQNLLTNAAKFKKLGEKPKIRVFATEKDAQWIISVSDNGIGIEKQYQDKVFQLFQRLHTKEKYEGTGIGLAICKKVAELHKGSIWIESALGEGTTFHFSIPKESYAIEPERKAA